MSRHTCPFSGVSWNSDVGYGNIATPHPIVQAPLDYLVSTQLPAWLAGKLAPVEIHLLGCAALRHLPISYWKHPISSSNSYLAPLWSGRLQRILTLATRVDQRKVEEYPHFAISKDTCDLDTLPDYLDALTAYLQYNQYSPSEANKRILEKAGQTYLTEKLYEILRDTQAKLQHRGRLPKLIAQWAANAGEFPITRVQVGRDNITLRDYWKLLIEYAFGDLVELALKVATRLDRSKEHTKDITVGDYYELLEHCETRIPYGSLHTDTLLARLRLAVEFLDDMRPKPVVIDLSLLREPKPTEAVLDESSPLSAYSAEPEPVKKNYATMAEYLKARVAWGQRIIQGRGGKQ